eukprot:scaffold60370_cov19-Tisochrysis_lutea.AAC.1
MESIRMGMGSAPAGATPRPTTQPQPLSLRSAATTLDPNVVGDGAQGGVPHAWDSPQGARATGSGAAAVQAGVNGSDGIESQAGQHQRRRPSASSYSSGSGGEGGSAEVRMRNRRGEAHMGAGRPVAEQEERVASVGRMNVHAGMLHPLGGAAGSPVGQDALEGTLGEISGAPPLPPQTPQPPSAAPLPHVLSLPSEITEVTEISEIQEECEPAQWPLPRRRKPWAWIDAFEDEQGQEARGWGVGYRGGQAVAEAEERPGMAAGSRPGTAVGSRPNTKGSARWVEGRKLLSVSFCLSCAWDGLAEWQGVLHPWSVRGSEVSLCKVSV